MGEGGRRGKGLMVLTWAGRGWVGDGDGGGARGKGVGGGRGAGTGGGGGMDKLAIFAEIGQM